MEYNSTLHQKKQIEVIQKVERQTTNNNPNFFVIPPVDDFVNDPRVCLTSAHITGEKLNQEIKNALIDPLQSKFSEHYYYPLSSLHMTVKNIRVVSDPPNFTQKDIEVARQAFASVVPRCPAYRVFFYRLLVLPTNLLLVGTTDPQLDRILNKLDHKLTSVGLRDDKKYANTSHFFCSMTLVRFKGKVSQEMRDEIQNLSKRAKFESYEVDSVTLLSCNAAFEQKKVFGEWDLLPLS